MLAANTNLPHPDSFPSELIFPSVPKTQILKNQILKTIVHPGPPPDELESLLIAFHEKRPRSKRKIPLGVLNPKKASRDHPMRGAVSYFGKRRNNIKSSFRPRKCPPGGGCWFVSKEKIPRRLRKEPDFGTPQKSQALSAVKYKASEIKVGDKVRHSVLKETGKYNDALGYKSYRGKHWSQVYIPPQENKKKSGKTVHKSINPPPAKNKQFDRHVPKKKRKRFEPCPPDLVRDSLARLAQNKKRKPIPLRKKKRKQFENCDKDCNFLGFVRARKRRKPNPWWSSLE